MNTFIANAIHFLKQLDKLLHIVTFLKAQA